VLGHDHVDVLKRSEEKQPQDRHPAVVDQRAQRPQRPVALADRPDAAVQLALEPQRDQREGQRRAEQCARHVEADRDQHQAAEQPQHPLGDDRHADRPVLPQALKRAALQRHEHPQRPSGRDRRRRPRHLLDPDQSGKLLAKQQRGRGHGDQADQQPPRPRVQGRAQHLGMPEAIERGLARRRRLHRLPRDQQDQEGRYQRRQRPVAGRAEQPREHDREHELDAVVDQRRCGQPGRLARLRLGQGISDVVEPADPA
jgi:hypothetical protein